MNKLRTYSKIFLQKIVIVENHLGENGDDCKKMYVTSIISGSKVFLETLLLPKDRQFILQYM